MPYMPIHDQPPYFGTVPSNTRSGSISPTPKYAPSDSDLSIPLHSSTPYKMSNGNGSFKPRNSMTRLLDESNGNQNPPDTPPSYVKHTNNSFAPRQTATYQPRASEGSSGSVKRRRVSGSGDYDEDKNEDVNGHGNGDGDEYEYDGKSVIREDQGQVLPQLYTRREGGEHHIRPSFFNLTARNPVSRVVGDLILKYCGERKDVEVEIKLGILLAPPAPGQRPRRVHLPAMTELVLPLDYPCGAFKSDMTKEIHSKLNALLNEQTSASASGQMSDPSSQWPIRYRRIKQKDEFFKSPSGGKVRVSTDLKTGEVTECIMKSKLVDINVANGSEPLDFRISINTEEKCSIPPGAPHMVREKDRLCYRHQLVQVDLTFVKTMAPDGNRPPLESYELEVEVMDVSRLVDEGHKAMAGLPNVYDEMITSMLDTARLLIRNVM